MSEKKEKAERSCVACVQGANTPLLGISKRKRKKKSGVDSANAVRVSFTISKPKGW